MREVRSLPTNGICPTLVSDLVHDRLLASIIAGDLKPGDRLKLAEIAEQYGVSRTPVREAVTRLARNNFVLVSRYTSTVVAPWETTGMRERLTATAAMATAGVPYLTPAALATLSEQFAEVATLDERTIIDVIDAVLAAAYPLLGEQMREDLVGPLLLFFGRSSASVATSPEGAVAWAPVATALQAQDRDGLARSLGRLSATLGATLHLADADAVNA